FDDDDVGGRKTRERWRNKLQREGASAVRIHSIGAAEGSLFDRTDAGRRSVRAGDLSGSVGRKNTDGGEISDTGNRAGGSRSQAAQSLLRRPAGAFPG